MSFLEDLRKKAEASKVESALEEQAEINALSQNFLLVQAKLRDAAAYLTQLAEHLNVLQHKINRNYYVDGYGLLQNLSQRDYAVSIEKITIDQKIFINLINLRFKCATPEPLAVEKVGVPLISSYKDYLWKNNLKYDCTEYRDAKGQIARAMFSLAGEIPVHVTLGASFEDALLTVTVRNFNGFTAEKFVYGVNEINATLLDEFAKYLIEQPNQLRFLGAEQQRKLAALSTKKTISFDYPTLSAEQLAQLARKEKKAGLLDSLKTIITGTRKHGSNADT